MNGKAVPVGVGAAAVVALMLRVDLSELPEVTRFRDDAYYGFTWVRSLVEGRGPVVSEGMRTSGVHPLWCFLLAIPGLLAGPGVLPVAAQVMGLLFHAGTAALLAFGPGRGSRGGVILGLVYLGNPVLIAEAQNGQETALACFCVLLLWHLRRRPAFTGAAALCVLARSDLAFVVAALSIGRDGFRPRSLITPAVAALPLLVFNLWAGGGWMQDSAAPIPWLFQQNFLVGNPDLAAHLGRVWWYLRPCLLGGPFAMVSPYWSGFYVFAVLRPFGSGRLRWLLLIATVAAWVAGAQDLLVPLLAGALLVLLPAAGRRPVRRELIALGIGLFLLVAAHEMWRNYPRNYYFAPVGIAGAVALLPLARGRWSAALLPLALLQAFDARQPVTEQRPWQGEMAMAGRLLDEVLDPGELVGSFNGGLVTWYRPDRVVNLDGRVNRDAFHALQDRELSRYLDDLGIRYVLDSELQFALQDPLPHTWGPGDHASGSFFGAGFRPETGLVEVARFDIEGTGGEVPGTDSFRLYWRVGAGPRPEPPAGFGDLGEAPGGGHYLRWSGAPGESLELHPPGGPRRTIARGQSGLVFVLRLARRADGAIGVFETGSETALLILPPL